MKYKVKVYWDASYQGSDEFTCDETNRQKLSKATDRVEIETDTGQTIIVLNVLKEIRRIVITPVEDPATRTDIKPEVVQLPDPVVLPAKIGQKKETTVMGPVEKEDIKIPNTGSVGTVFMPSAGPFAGGRHMTKDGDENICSACKGVIIHPTMWRRGTACSVTCAKVGGDAVALASAVNTSKMKEEALARVANRDESLKRTEVARIEIMKKEALPFAIGGLTLYSDSTEGIETMKGGIKNRFLSDSMRVFKDNLALLLSDRPCVQAFKEKQAQEYFTMLVEAYARAGCPVHARELLHQGAWRDTDSVTYGRLNALVTAAQAKVDLALSVSSAK